MNRSLPASVSYPNNVKGRQKLRWQCYDGKVATLVFISPMSWISLHYGPMFWKTGGINTQTTRDPYRGEPERRYEWLLEVSPLVPVVFVVLPRSNYVSNEKKHGWLGYIGIIINQYYKDLYWPTSTMESSSSFFFRGSCELIKLLMTALLGNT